MLNRDIQTLDNSIRGGGIVLVEDLVAVGVGLILLRHGFLGIGLKGGPEDREIPEALLEILLER